MVLENLNVHQAFRDVFHVHRRLRSIHGSSLVFMFMLVDGSAQVWSLIWMSVRLAGVLCLHQDGLRGLLGDHRVSTQRNGH